MTSGAGPCRRPWERPPARGLVIRSVRGSEMEGHTKVAGERPAGLGGGNAGGIAVPAAVDGRQAALPVRDVQDRDQDHEPVVHGIAVPYRLHRRYTTWESRGASCKGGQVEGIRRLTLHAVTEGLITRVDHLLGLGEAHLERTQCLPDGLDRRQPTIAQHVSIDLSAGLFLQIGPPAAHCATSRDPRACVIRPNVRQEPVYHPALRPRCLPRTAQRTPGVPGTPPNAHRAVAPHGGLFPLIAAPGAGSGKHPGPRHRTGR